MRVRPEGRAARAGCPNGGRSRRGSVVPVCAGEKRGSGYRVERSTGVGVEHAGPAWDRLPGKGGRQWEIQRTFRHRF